MKKLIFILTALVMLLTSCASDGPAYHTQLPAQANRRQPVSPQTAVERARAAVLSLNESPTRSQDLRVHSIEARASMSALTRSSSQDTLIYIINFEDEAGFAIVGADERMQQIYAVSDEGNFVEPTDDDTALQDVMSGIIADAQYSITLPIDSLNPPTPPKPFEVKVKYGPYLSRHINRLSHSVEMSKYCRNKEGKPTRTGCVAIATVQLMSFYKWPDSYTEFPIDEELGDWRRSWPIDWDKICAGENDDQLKMLIALVGLPENLDMGYYPTVDTIAGANIDNVRRTLRNLEYQSGGDYEPFFANEETVKQLLKTIPLITYAYSTEHKSGHLWVIDGYLAYCFPAASFEQEPTPYKYLYHCVWGDTDGNCNGYYYVADTNTFIGGPDEYDNIDPGENGGAEQYHQHVLNIKYLDGVKAY